jgi:hypothetical protein
MAVYQGARLRTTAAPAGRITPRQARAAAPAPVATTPRVRPMGLLMAATVGVTILGLVYLTQTLDSNATSTEIYLMEKESGDLFGRTRSLQIQIMETADSDEVIRKAKKQKLKRLDGIDVLPAP